MSLCALKRRSAVARMVSAVVRLGLALALAMALGLAGCGDGLQMEEPDTTAHPTFPCGPYVDPMESFVDRSLQWTPDGSHLLFLHGTTIHIVSADGSQVRQLVDVNPAWEGERSPYVFLPYGFHFNVSPYGKRVVYATCEFPSDGVVEGGFSYRDSERAKYHYEIAVIDWDGTGKQRLTDNLYLDTYPVWSPDGRRIAFIGRDRLVKGYKKNARQFYTMEADGTSVQPVILLEESVPALAPPLWSPDGAYLAVLVKEEDAKRDKHMMYVIRADGSGLMQIAEVATVPRYWLGYTNDPAPVFPAWSPDSAYLGFVMADEEGRASGFYIVRPDGAELRHVSELPGANWNPSQVLWSPDGSEILVVSDQRLFFIQPDGSGLRRLDVAITSPAWRAAAWSRDGTRIALYDPGSPYPHEIDREPPRLYTIARDGSNGRDLIRLDDNGNLAPANPPQD